MESYRKSGVKYKVTIDLTTSRRRPAALKGEATRKINDLNGKELDADLASLAAEKAAAKAAQVAEDPVAEDPAASAQVASAQVASAPAAQVAAKKRKTTGENQEKTAKKQRVTSDDVVPPPPPGSPMSRAPTQDPSEAQSSSFTVNFDLPENVVSTNGHFKAPGTNDDPCVVGVWTYSSPEEVECRKILDRHGAAEAAEAAESESES